MGGVGALLPEWEVAEDWLEMGQQIQEVLLLNQVYPDGFQKEICTQYHKTVIRSFATLQMILARRGLSSFYDTEPFRTRFLAEILTPDGFTPAINSAVYAQDWPAFLASGNSFFKDPVLQWHIDRGYHHEGYLRSKGVRHERTVLLKKGRYFLIYDLLDATESEEAHTLRWTLRCPDELREIENRMVVSTGDPGIRLAPAWSDAIHDVEIGWGPSMVPLIYRPDMSAQKAQVCHVRFVQEIDAGAQARFLVLMVSGECQDGAVRGEVVNGEIEATVTAWGETERIVLK